MSGDRAQVLADSSPFTRSDWARALDVLGPWADELLPTVQQLCMVIGRHPEGAAAALLAAMDIATPSRLLTSTDPHA